MEIGGFGLGIFFIVLGFLVKRFPNLMAGYNTMSKEEKANVEIEGLTNFARNTMILIGLVLIVSFAVLKWIGQIQYFNYVNFGIIIIGVVYLIVGAQKYDNN